MKSIKYTALFLTVLLLLLSGCRGNIENNSSSMALPQSSESVTVDNEFTLLYSSSDTFNPYTAKTDTNRQLCKLLYEPLIKLDNNFNVNYVLAESAELKGTTCTVNIKNAVFSDGSSVTADDVVYSFKLAKASATEYAYKLYGASSISAAGGKTVVFKLNKADPYFLNLLDFPILKAGSEKRTDSDSVVLPPIGGGRYCLNEKANALVINQKSNPKAQSYQIKEIELISAPDSESLSHYVEVGAADIYYSDISDGNIIRMSGSKVDININHLVYIGVNLSNKILAEDSLRQAISSGIDRTAVCRDSYYNNAIPANGFFNPAWEPIKSVQNIEITPNEKITVENLEKIGYNSLDKMGIRQNKAGVKLKFNLLVNKENRLRVAAARLIAAKLSSYGIKINVVEKPYAAYIADLSSGNFELYFAEIYLTPNMDLTELIAEGGSSAYGIKALSKEETDSDKNETEKETEEPKPEEKSATSAELVAGLYNGKNTVTDVASVLQTEMPIIPVCYRTGVLFYNDNIGNVVNSSMSDIFFSIDSYSFKIKNN